LAAGILFAAATCGATPAFAQDHDAHFNGFKVEAVTGLDSVGFNFDKGVYTRDKGSESGWLYGLGIGYDYQTGPWVFGLEGEWTDSTAGKEKDFSGVRPTNPIAGVPTATPVVTHLNAKASSDIGLTARVGYAATPQLLLYIKGGWSFAKMPFKGNGLDNNIAFTFSDNPTIDGFRIGAGGEYMFSDHFYAKAEYRYTNYTSGHVQIQGAYASQAPLIDGFAAHRHQLLMGAGFRF
jgi:outer membrane immunogenic protein